MTTMTDIDLDALGVAVDAALAELPDEPEPTRPALRIARRATVPEAKAHFDRGGDVLVHERGHEQTVPVSPDTTVHNSKSISWQALRDQVAMWRNRYPRQRYYIVPDHGQSLPDRPEKPKPAPTAEWKKPTWQMPHIEPVPSVMDAITEAVGSVLTGNHATTVEKRDLLIKRVSDAIANLPIYGIELDGARLGIGDPIELDNANVEVDGYGRAVSITVEAGTPIWDPQ